MEIKIDDQFYQVVIKVRNNKNTYIRVSPELIITVTTNPLMTKKEIANLLEQNKPFLKKAIFRRKKEMELSQSFYYLGNKYDIVYLSTINNVSIDNNKIYTKNDQQLNRWYENEMYNIFNDRLEYNYNLFREKIPYPTLKLRAMKTRWGVCNISKKTITLNKNLIRYKIDIIDYVIIHELAHFIHPNHSSDFWKLVNYYLPNYQELRKELRG